MKNHYRPEIDGLRAVAVVFVLLFHISPRILPGGFIGVDVFFVISGYLITGIIVREIDTGSFTFRNFYERRARRLLPALFTVLLSTLAIGWAILVPSDLEQLARQAIAGLLFVPNLLFWREAGYFDTSAQYKTLLHLWSLGVEEQFYLFWPVLTILLARRRKSLIAAYSALTAISFALSVYATYRHPVAGFFLPPFRIWELGLGGVLALTAIRLANWASAVGVLLIVVSGLALSSDDPFPGLRALPPVLGAAMVVAGSSRLLSMRHFVGVGLISYPLYLWHWPLLSIVARTEYDTLGVRIALGGLAILCATATYLFVERPIRFGGLRTLTLPVSAAGTMVIAGICAAIVAVHGAPFRFPASISPVLALLQYPPNEGARYERCWLSEAEFSAYGAECRKGDVLVWGDSYAGRLWPGLHHIAGEVAQFNRSGCMPILNEVSALCARSNRAVLDEISKIRPKTVVIFAAWWRADRDWRIGGALHNELRSVLQALRIAGIERTIVVGQTPQWTPGLPRSVYSYWLSERELPDRLPPQTAPYEMVDAYLRLAAEQEQAIFAPLAPLLCADHRCITHIPQDRAQLLSFDEGHFTLQDAIYAAQLLGFEKTGRRP